MIVSKNKDLLYSYLPKWPQMYVTGKPIPVDQAKEIIRRTDTFFTHGYDGNDRAYNAWIRQVLGIPEEPTHNEDMGFLFAYFERRNKWREDWGCLITEYVHNSWVSSAFFFGPHGWCHPDGTIGFIDNVGKWPSVEEILDDWNDIAEAFPFLDIGVTLMDGEEIEKETKPVVSIVVKGDQVSLVEPSEGVHAGHPPMKPRSDYDIVETLARRRMPRGETAIPEAWIKEWSEK